MRVDFSVPAEFVDIPIGIDFNEAWAEANANNARVSLAAQQDQASLTTMAETLHRVSQILNDVGVVYAANCLHSFEGEPSLASLAVAVFDLPYGDDTATAARGALRSILDYRGAEWSGSVIDAPCGPVAVFTGGQNYKVPSDLAPDGKEAEISTAQFHAVIPMPPVADIAGQRMCLIAFSTPNISHWEACYAPIMATVLRSLRFTEADQGSGSIAPELHGR